jgi:predicted O-methyltransferase YrrM
MMAWEDACNSTIQGIFQRLTRDENVGAPTSLADFNSQAGGGAPVVVDLAAEGLEGASIDGLRAAPFVLVLGLSEVSHRPLWLQLLRSAEYVLLDRTSRRPTGHALFMRADRPPHAYATVAGAVESIHGYLDPGQEQFLFEKAKSLPDDAVIIEIGSYHGRSTAALAFACVGTRRKVYCLDLWGSADLSRHSGFFNQFKNNLSSRRLWPYIVPLHGPSAQVLGRWEQLTGRKRVDFDFDDASHQYDQTLAEFELFHPLVKDGGWIAFHDVRPCWPGPLWIWNNVARQVLEAHERVGSLACGRKVGSREFAKPSLVTPSPPRDAQGELPVHFLTIVLNGMLFLPRTLEVLRQLPFPWHWHVVEGVAELDFDTAWSKAQGGRVPDWAHREGLSIDGTSEFLDRLVKEERERIRLYRNEGGKPFLGKNDMVNRVATEIAEPCLLWQIDADELWTASQIAAAREMFLREPERTAARYWSWYFVGPGLVTSTRHSYGNDSRRDGLRTWRFEPGMLFFSHEPPVLGNPQADGRVIDVGAANPFSADEMDRRGVVFQHHPWATLDQARFKEAYYGYEGAVDAWRALQAQPEFPVALREFFPWVHDDTLVDRAESYVERSLLMGEDASRF